MLYLYDLFIKTREVIMEKIIDYVSLILLEVIEYFRYSPFVIMNYPYNKEMDKAILEYLKKDIHKVELDSYNMYLFSEDKVMRLWTSNRWYAFCNDVIIGTIHDTTKIDRWKSEKYTYLNISFDPAETISYKGRPSFRALGMLKYIYLKSGGKRHD